MVERTDVSKAIEKESFQRRRVVVTGMGAVTPLGLNVETTWKNIKDGKNGISEVDLGYPNVQIAGVIKEFDLLVRSSGLLTKKDLTRMARSSQLSLGAAKEGLANANLIDESEDLLEGLDSTQIGVIIGTGIGGGTEIADIGVKLSKGERVDTYSALRVEPERVATVVSMKFGLKGPLYTPTAACATGNIAITLGYKEIVEGEADIMIVGGVESMFGNPFGEAVYDAVRALTNEKNIKASRPFDKKRNGFVMGEGAGVLILEEYEHAKKRDARILAELVGYKNTADAMSDTEPSREGAERAMLGAIKKAGKIAIDGTIYINAHATSTPKGDRAETLAIKKIYEGKEKNIAVSSTKGATGHLMGGAGAVEAIISIKALNEGVIPPTINLNDPLEEGEGLNLVPNDAQKKRVDAVVNNSFGFGGINSVTIFANPED